MPMRRWRLCDVDPVTGVVRYSIAILQGESRSEFNTTQYAACMEALCGFLPLEPVEGGTFVAHHMVFHSTFVFELLDLMRRTTGSTLPWPLLIMSYSRKFYRFSEYKTYATYMIRRHPGVFMHHGYEMFGEGGLRFREANAVVGEMLSYSPVSPKGSGGLSYSQVVAFVQQSLSPVPISSTAENIIASSVPLIITPTPGHGRGSRGSKTWSGKTSNTSNSVRIPLSTFRITSSTINIEANNASLSSVPPTTPSCTAMSSSPPNCAPGYVQLDHVYGLTGLGSEVFDVNFANISARPSVLETSTFVSANPIATTEVRSALPKAQQPQSQQKLQQIRKTTALTSPTPSTAIMRVLVPIKITSVSLAPTPMLTSTTASPGPFSVKEEQVQGKSIFYTPARRQVQVVSRG